MMIARIWHGVTAAAKADQYLEYLNQTGILDYQATTGNLGVYVLQRIEEDKAHFQLISLWESFEAIKNFAGLEPEKARYYPQDTEFLLELEETVTHYKVSISPSQGETMKELERIKDQVERTFTADAWHGPALLETLTDVTAEKAVAKPAGNSHSIWEILLHITTWEEVTRRRLIGDIVNVSDEEDWPTVSDTSEAAWRSTLAIAEDTHQKLLDAISQLSDTDLNRAVNSQAGIEHSIYVSLHGAIHHLLYHTGQIALLKKLI
jgi:uncharacterized damage-inducible protein DinB/heme-degrading monooxygenase HmoA